MYMQVFDVTVPTINVTQFRIPIQRNSNTQVYAAKWNLLKQNQKIHNKNTDVFGTSASLQLPEYHLLFMNMPQ